MRVTAIVDVCEPSIAKMAMAPLGAATLLARILMRCAAIPKVNAVACVLSDAPECDALADEADRGDARVFRGDAADALGLCARAASETGADTVIRVTGDRPFIDPALCERVLALLEQSETDYACNDLPATWPHGLDCETYPARLLHWADTLAVEARQRAAAGDWIRVNSDLRKANLTGPGGDFARMRWTLAFPEDLAFAQAVFAHLGERAATASAAELAAFCLRRPDVAALNAKRSDRRRLTSVLRADFVTEPVSLSQVA
jgi:spore coat polysaccharide biosynthesis protein SpsF (cytidylyltransferase family)